ncbi:YcxB family protein [Pelosinus propionicus]|uniref:YcxB-like protein n=1 Tax=Pelosinus propionicus DSM 13327 TaxID=1123291 RepID=A0A1I4Q698_9FIRM|nr:YcxB family protein [Pelosinus propionicus]SFM35599.1 YcxB-like protein [Pelosinus propionicus DSM 13327]
METIHVLVKLELQDYQHFYRLSNEKWLYGFYGFFLSAIIGNIMVDDISGIAYILLILAMLECYKRINIKKQFKSNQLDQKEVVYEITSDGIEVTSVDGSSKSNVKWDELFGVKRNKNMIFFMTGRASGLIIPKRLLTTLQVSRLEGLIKDHLSINAFIKTNFFKYGAIGVLLNLTTVILSTALNISQQRLSDGYSMRHSIVNLVQLILMILTFGSGITFVIQCFRWLYGSILPKHRIKFSHVLIALLAFICMIVVIGVADYYIYQAWQLHKS